MSSNTPLNATQANMVKETIRPQIERGRIFYTNPELNFYYILPDTVTPISLDGVIPAIDTATMSPVAQGASVIETYPIGSPVFYTRVIDGNSDKMQAEAVILGINKERSIVNQSVNQVWTTTPLTSVFTGSNDPSATAFISLSDEDMQKDRSYGRPEDMCDSDWMVAGTYHNYFKVGYGVVSVVASPMNGLHFYTIDNGTVLNTGSYFIHDTPLSRHAVYFDSDADYTEVTQFSALLAESMGAYGKYGVPFKGPVFGPSAEIYQLQQENQKPIFRVQELKGCLVSGTQVSVCSTENLSGYNINDNEKDIMRGVCAVHTGYDGTYSVISAKSVTLGKDAYVPFIQQLEDEVGTQIVPPETRATAVTDIYTMLPSGKAKDFAAQFASDIYEFSRTNFVARFFKKVKERITNWRVNEKKRILNILGISEESLNKLRALGPDEPSYSSAENLVQVVDPVNPGGYNARDIYNALSAFVHVSPTGAVVISDGYGAEIKLEGGNITLTCPGDIKVLPGRDYISLVPRNGTVFTKGRLDIASDTKEVSIKSEKGLKLLAKNGVLALESQGVERASYVDKLPKGSGILLKSNSVATIVGNDIRLGVQASDDVSKTGRVDKTGSILIDANDGAAFIFGKAVAMRGKTSASVVGNNAAVIVSESVLVAAPAVDMASYIVRLGTDAKSFSMVVPKMSNNGVETESISMTSNNEGGVNCSMLLNGSIIASESIVGKNVLGDAAQFYHATADVLLSKNGWLWDRSSQTLHPKERYWETIRVVSSEIISQYSNALGYSTAAISAVVTENSLFTAYGTKGFSLYYPTTTEYYATSTFWPRFRWQKMRALSGSVSTWKPNPVKDPDGNDTLPYPGNDAWTKQNFISTLEFNYDEANGSSVNMLELGPLAQAYIVNSSI